MIFDSNSRKNYKKLANHLMSDENEDVTIMGSSGILQSLNMHGALSEMAAIGRATSTTKYLYHVSASPGDEVTITDKQWKKVWSLYEKVQGLKGQNYIEVEHKKKGRVHRHRVYLRVDPVTGQSIQMPWTKIKNERIARELEHEFGHPIVKGRHTKSVIEYLKKEKDNDELINILEKSLPEEKPIAQLNHVERQMVRRGMDVKDHKKNIYEAWREYKRGKSFYEELKNRGLYLAMGDKAVIAVSFEGVDLPVLRSINYFQRKNDKRRVSKKELDKAIKGELIHYEKLKENREVMSTNIKVDYFDKVHKEKIILHGSTDKKSKKSSYHLQQYIKSILGEGEKIYRSSSGAMYVGNNKKFTMEVSSKKITLVGEKVIVNHVERVMDIAKFNQWKNVKIESSKLKYKQYYVDTMYEMMVPEFSTNSSKKFKQQTSAVDEIELVSNEEDMIRHRRKLLLDEYFEDLEESELADHWTIKKLSNGYIKFENENGSFVDKGNKISVAATQGNLKSCSKGALMLAKLKGWKTITVKGTNDFKFSIYRHAHTFGIKIQKNSDYDDGLMKKVITELKNKTQKTKNESKIPKMPKEVLSPKKPSGPGM